MSETLQPLPKEITDEIRSILTRCKSGELKHYQSDFHCGTSHCIAGWKAVFDYSKRFRNKKILNADFSKTCFGEQVADYCRERKTGDEFNTVWQYALEQWQLTKTESNILFRDCATFDEQFALLEKLERGERI